MKHYLRFTILFVLVFFIYSCSSDEEFYSCDPEADAWVKENLSEIKNMKAVEWYSMNDIARQKAAYVAFGSNQRQELWLSKLHQILELDWTNLEREHIYKLVSFIEGNPLIFENKVEVDDDVELMLYKWKEYALEELKWKHELIYAIITTPEKLNKDKKLNIVIAEQNNSPVMKTRSESGGDKLPLCDCYAPKDIFGGGSSGGWILCSYIFYHCNTGVCESRYMGCGDFWLYGCNGLCVER